MKFLEKRKQNKALKQVNALDDKFTAMSDDDLKRYSYNLQERAKAGESKDKLLPEAYALAREAAWRVLRKKPYDVQVIGAYVLNTGNVAEMSTGSGKANPVSFPVPTPSGWKTVGDIEVGDELLDRLGKPTLVTGKFPQGIKTIYEVTLEDGRVIPCAAEHLWTVYSKNKETGELIEAVKMTKDLVGIGFGEYSIPNNKAVQYSKQEVNENLYDYASRLIYSRSSNVRLKEEYKLGSTNQRRKLVRGLFNASITMFPPIKGKRYIPKIAVFSKGLRDDIMEVLYSLGVSCSYITTSSGSTRERYLIKINDRQPAVFNFLGSKIARRCGYEIFEDSDKELRSTIFIKSVVKTDKEEEQVCFTVDNEEHLFLIGDYVVTHNTLTEVLPAYLNALDGRGVHIITVNDYLAQRDMEEMGKVFKFLGLTVSWIHSDLSNPEKQLAYQADIVYGTNNEFGFDYLRDNMVKDKSKRVQRELNYCIIDEVDSILIDEARTPLIISSNSSDSSDIYKIADMAVKNLQRGEDEPELTKFEKMDLDSRELTPEEIEAKKDFQVNEKYSTISLTDRGIKKIESALGIDNLGSPENAMLYHHVLQAIRARHLMKRNVDYIVSDGEVLIVDASTGRTMSGRRFSDGLHQALEAKEDVEIQGENVTSATITLQNYFRLYNKISGMTGTAKTEEQEFIDIYGMRVYQIPDNKPCIRNDKEDIVYASQVEKELAVYMLANEASLAGRPVLIGTSSIEASESLSRCFDLNGLKHELLNAKSTFNQSISSATREALIIAQAGQSGKVTIATNMAGRGTDILLGGNPEFLAVQDMLNEGYTEEQIEEAKSFLHTDDEDLREAQEKYQEFLDIEKDFCDIDREKVVEAGGLFVIGTDRHDSRRIDNQLRGRAGRQGDPGSSQFIISLEDKLFAVYGGSMVDRIAESFKGEAGPLYKGGLMAKTIERSQKNIESQNFQQRKNVLEYDEIDNVQREEVYGLRNRILDGEDVEEDFRKFLRYGCEFISQMTDEEIKMDDKLELLKEELLENKKETKRIVGKHLADLWSTVDSLGTEEDTVKNIKVQSLLMALDMNWKEHLIILQNLKESTRMTGFSQMEPIEVYKREASEAFNEFKYMVGKELITILISMNIIVEEVEEE